MLIRKPSSMNSHNFFHEKGGTAMDSSSTASSKIRIFSRASNATSSSSSHVDDDSDRDCGCSRRLVSSSSAPSRSFRAKQKRAAMPDKSVRGCDVYKLQPRKILKMSKAQRKMTSNCQVFKNRQWGGFLPIKSESHWPLGQFSFKQPGKEAIVLLTVDVNANSDEEDGEEAEEDDGVDEDRYPARMHVPKLHHLAPSRQLEQQPRTQKHEQHHSYHHRPPIRHSIFTIYEMIFLLFLLLCVQV
ncbi:hypothetical protein ACFX11_011914 [Malus domestica]